jgi:beta-phosphoglucomutase family hydrolase
MTEIRTVIFDMDGVISDTQKLHASVEEKLLKKYGIRMSSDEITEKYAGISAKEFFGKIFEAHGISVDVERVINEKWGKMICIAKNNTFPLPGAVELITQLKKNGFKLGVASTSSHKFIELVLSELKLKEKFDVIVSGEDVKFGKPNPEIFLLTSKKLDVQPSECVVIEDGINGIIAAKRAGMKCILLTRENKGRYSADLVISSLKELSIEKIKNL